MKQWQPQERVGFSVPCDGLAAVQRNGLNVLAHNAHVQFGEQEQYEAEIFELRNQVSLQHMLLRDVLEQEYVRVDTGGGMTSGAEAQGGGAATSLTQMEIMPPTASPQPSIVGGPKPEGYLYVDSHHHGAPIWGSMDTMLLSRMGTNADAAASDRT